MSSSFRDSLSEYIEPETLFLGSDIGEFDSAIMGVGERDGHPVLIYDEHLIVACLQAQGMSDEESWDWFGYNILGHRSRMMPIYVRTLSSLGMSAPKAPEPVAICEELDSL